jgi:hypothetical protein
MRKLFVFIVSTGLLFACNNNKNKEKTASADSLTKDSAAVDTGSSNTFPGPAPSPLEKFLGSFVGPFGDNKITMLITKVVGDSVIGRSIVGGNDRPFRGSFKKEGNLMKFDAVEPGDNKDDGEFKFQMDDATPDIVSGNWTPNDKKRPAKAYQLQRKVFAYDPAVGTFPEASQRLLKVKDVENMMKEDLMFMRNEIFARHGYCFNKKDLRQEFELQDWYVPNTVNIKGFLTDVEKKNIALIKRYEKYAEQYGDEYGR